LTNPVNETRVLLVTATEEDPMAQDLKIQKYTYTNETTQQTFHGETSPDDNLDNLDESYTQVVETVRVVFAVNGAEVESISARRRHVIDQLVITFRSVDGASWRADYDPNAFGTGVLRDGADGARTKLRSFDFPAWLNELIKRDAYGWINAEYPR
jgi:hypothetical protein